MRPHRWTIVLTVTESGNHYPLPMRFWIKWRARLSARAMNRDLEAERMTVAVERTR